MSGRAAKFCAIGRDEFGLRRRSGAAMRLKEFATPKSASKSASKDANAGKAEAIRREQQKLAYRDAQLKVQNTEQQLTKQSKRSMMSRSTQ
jgi:hypothetical protein